MGRLGLVMVARELVEKWGGVEVKMSKKTRQALTKEAIVVTSNHPGELDPLILAANLPKRNDISFIADANLLGRLKNLDKYLIPVYIQNNIETEGRRTRREKLLKKLGLIKKLEKEEEGRRNRESIKKASEKLKKGGLVVIYPEANDGHWYAGVGYMLAGVGNKKVRVVMAEIKKSNKWSWLRLIPGAGKLMGRFRIRFSEPLVAKGKTGKEITVFLEERFREFEKLSQ